MQNCIEDGRLLILTGEEGTTGYYECPKCGKKYKIDLRDDSILKIKFVNGNIIKPVSSNDNVRGNGNKYWELII